MHQAFRDLHATTREALSRLADGWAEGLLSARSFADAMDEVLLTAHTQAVVIGRTHAGDDAPEEADDRRFAETVVEGEHDYLQAFREQMDTGRYLTPEGHRDGAAVARRAEHYAGRLTGTCNEVWALTLPEDTLLTWTLARSEEGQSCADCPEIAGRSPFTPATIPTYPGRNETLCRGSCRCSVTTQAGLSGFVTPD